MEGIYCIEHISSGRKYYGSSMNVEKRLKQHQLDLQKQKHHNIQLQRAVDKHSISDFNFYLIEETQFNNRQLLLNLEQEYIDNNLCGYNMAPANGGDCISQHPNRELIVEKIRQATVLRNSQLTSKERKVKYGRAGSTNGNWKNGGSSHKLCPICNTNKISVFSKNCNICRDRTKENNPFYNKHHSKETKRLLGELNSGDNSWIKGIDPSLLPYTKSYIITYPNGESKKVAGLKIIAEEFNVSIANVHNTIKRMACGKLPTRSVFVNHFIKEVD
jgi:group I intron endonuclease